ncbi:OsmC family protein [Actinacidiphila acididurans]|uniref:OsmC family protein n=1 Tax=Actinacidiphila acididurans TaxID=2784346 RepID=A0ABS2TY05_9ACTN|nr:OsmC family protein [Actinacidiphila acididurans]MBM9508221.1 OsmC family protein [Actinacidiphila acididurans]
MADNTVVVGTTRTQGRFLAEARERLLVVDSTDSRGGRGQAWLAGELLLAALGACATSSVTHFAREEAIALDDVEAKVSYTRHPTDPTAYEEVVLEVTTWGVTREEADLLVRLYTENCPVYGTTSRGATVRVAVDARTGRAEADR